MNCSLCSEVIAPGDLVLNMIRFFASAGLYNGHKIRRPHLQCFVFNPGSDKMCHLACLKKALGNMDYQEANSQNFLRPTDNANTFGDIIDEITRD